MNKDRIILNLEQNLDREKLKDLPNPRLHKIVSFIKSGSRIVACGLGVAGFYEIGFVGLLLAEIVGIYEELV
tara:strand:+ start:1707 stop:1922 length:216 start_codon:yes stop_codon:yes gene_type:complete